MKHASLLLVFGVIAIYGLMMGYVTGCTHTREAYASAHSLDEYAYVLAEHYSSLVKQAADLKEKPTTPRSAVQAMRQADDVARPAIAKLKVLRDTFVQVRDAQTEADLQNAVDDAVKVIAELVRAVRDAEGRDNRPTLNHQPVFLLSPQVLHA